MMGVMMMIFFLCGFVLPHCCLRSSLASRRPDPTNLYAALLTSPEGLGMIAVGSAVVPYWPRCLRDQRGGHPDPDGSGSHLHGRYRDSARAVARNFGPCCGRRFSPGVLVGVLTFYRWRSSR
ncbi:hypothetical protein DSL92_01970 [Billgrantia gudaonensis]|uniref:Uncharacterized protein n=1 Tax=Billgrantia gudaonensis TaxID=376427 RepID=A0A3S0QG94_9GAMM|nr:hypothetical protein DSL92_01970 [Halomonas gudaonensis]